MVAGYCWDWVSKKQPSLYDIVIGRFRARWNLESDGSLWILKEEAVSEIGCVHTSQGLELEYVGVIFGEDLIVRNGVVHTQPDKRASTDKSLSGFKTLFRTSRQEAQRKADQIIRNTYRTLMTRAQKGCYLYSVDPETNEYLRACSVPTATARSASVSRYSGALNGRRENLSIEVAEAPVSEGGQQQD